MKLFYILLLVVYFGGLLVIYVDLPEREIQEEGSADFYSCYEYDCAQIFIDLANISVNTKCAFYDLDEPRMLNYFQKNDEHLVLYEDNNDYGLGNSIKILGLMHHKFCVFDNYLTLTGSWNPTTRGTEKNDNYIILMTSQTIAKKFSEEYDRLMDQKPQGSDYLNMKLSNMSIQLCFSPKNNCGNLIVNEINKANNSVKMLAFSFTDKDIADSLVKAKVRGVNVSVLFEKTRISKYSVISYLNDSNVGVFLDTNPYTMHEKLILIDNKTAILGSYNPSDSAENKNDENLVIITNFSNDFLKDIDRELSRVYTLP